MLNKFIGALVADWVYILVFGFSSHALMSALDLWLSIWCWFMHLYSSLAPFLPHCTPSSSWAQPDEPFSLVFVKQPLPSWRSPGWALGWAPAPRTDTLPAVVCTAGRQAGSFPPCRSHSGGGGGGEREDHEFQPFRQPACWTTTRKGTHAFTHMLIHIHRPMCKDITAIKHPQADIKSIIQK